AAAISAEAARDVVDRVGRTSERVVDRVDNAINRCDTRVRDGYLGHRGDVNLDPSLVERVADVRQRIRDGRARSRETQAQSHCEHGEMASWTHARFFDRQARLLEPKSGLQTGFISGKEVACPTRSERSLA